MIVKLPYKDRKVISEVAKLYMDMEGRGGKDMFRMRQFKMIATYAKIGVLPRSDVEDMVVAMEAFYDAYIKNPHKMDPSGTFIRVGEVIPKMKELLGRDPTEAEEPPKEIEVPKKEFLGEAPAELLKAGEAQANAEEPTKEQPAEAGKQQDEAEEQ